MPLQYRKTLTVSAASTTAVAAAQTLVGAGNMTLTSSTVTLPNAGQRPQMTSTGNLSAVNFTFYGTDTIGNSVSLAMAGPNNNTVVLPLTMQTITRIAADAAVGTNTSAGYAAQADLPPLPLDLSSDATNISLTGILVSGAGTPAFTVRFTQDNVQDATLNPGSYVWFNHGSLVAQTASATGNFAYPVVAASMFLDGNAQAAVAKFILIQSVLTS